MAKVIVKEPKSAMRIVDIPKNVWWEIQKTVCNGEEYGAMDRVHFSPTPYEFTMYVDDNGLLKNLPFNFLMEFNDSHYPLQKIVGTAIFARGNLVDEDVVYEDVTDEDIKTVKAILARGDLIVERMGLK